MRFITSFSKAYYEKYAWKLVESFNQYLPEHELIAYTEDKATKSRGNLTVLDIYEKCPKLEMLEKKYANVPKPDISVHAWRWDVFKFAKKSFAICHGVWQGGKCFWLDADCVVHQRPPDGFFENLLPEEYYLGYFGREKCMNVDYTETGFIAFNADHPENHKFLEEFRDIYLSGRIFEMQQWHDCIAFDLARKVLTCKTKSFGPDHIKTLMHPIAQSEVGKYIDHMKGNRKNAGHSEESSVKWWKRPESIQWSVRPAVLGDGK
jgi:hypothetical protein